MRAQGRVAAGHGAQRRRAGLDRAFCRGRLLFENSGEDGPAAVLNSRPSQIGRGRRQRSQDGNAAPRRVARRARVARVNQTTGVGERRQRTFYAPPCCCRAATCRRDVFVVRQVNAPLRDFLNLMKFHETNVKKVILMQFNWKLLHTTTYTIPTPTENY